VAYRPGHGPARSAWLQLLEKGLTRLSSLT